MFLTGQTSSVLLLLLVFTVQLLNLPDQLTGSKQMAKYKTRKGLKYKLMRSDLPCLSGDRQTGPESKFV